MRQRHKEEHAKIHGDSEKTIDIHDTSKTNLKPCNSFVRTCLMFFSEFRFIILTVLVIVAAITLQHTIQDAIDVYIKSKLKSNGARIGWMFLFSTLLIILTIIIVILWKPVLIPPKKEKFISKEKKIVQK